MLNTTPLTLDPSRSLPTSVQPLETPVDPSASTRLERPPWITRTNPIVEQICTAFRTSRNPHHHKRASKLQACCRFPAIRVRPNGEPFFSAGRCRDRLCPTCSACRSREVAERVNHLVSKAPQLRLLTLTLRSTSSPLQQQLDHLTSSFRRLRQTSTWATYCRASVATIQITLNQETNQWHPHLHALIEGNYMPHPEVKAAWCKATGGSDIVDIRPVHDRATTTTYIARYVASPNDITEYPLEAIREYADALHCRRTVITTGEWHNVGLPPRDNDPQEGPSSELLPLCIIAWGLRNDRWEAKALWSWLRAKMPASVYFLPQYPGGEPPPLSPTTTNEFTTTVPTVAKRLADLYWNGPKQPPTSTRRTPPAPFLPYDSQ